MNKAWLVLGLAAVAGLVFIAPEAMAIPEVVQSKGSASKVEQIQEFVKLAVNLSYLLGAILFAMSMWGFKKSGENANQHPVSQSIMTMVAGVLLLSIGAFYNITSETIAPQFTGSSKGILEMNPHIADLKITADNRFASFIPAESGKAILAFIYLVGLFSFIKGVYMLKDIGASQQFGSNQGSAGKCATHIMAGVIAMNITKFSCIVGNFLGTDKICLAISGI